VEDFLGPSKTDPQDPLQSSAPVIPGSDEYLPAPGDEGGGVCLPPEGSCPTNSCQLSVVSGKRKRVCGIDRAAVFGRPSGTQVRYVVPDQAINCRVCLASWFLGVSLAGAPSGPHAIKRKTQAKPGLSYLGPSGRKTGAKQLPG
jgi:hypothetical protein